eukprot:9403302-Ditylum_brightwellii.AAC.2
MVGHTRGMDPGVLRDQSGVGPVCCGMLQGHYVYRGKKGFSSGYAEGRTFDGMTGNFPDDAP